MPRKYKIEYLPIAYDDLEEIAEYIKKDNPAAAMETIDRIEVSIRKLEAFPESGIIPKDVRLRRTGYRMLVIDNYLVFYVIDNNIVEIRRVIQGSRQYSFLL